MAMIKEEPKKDNSRLLAAVLPLLMAQHNVQALTGDRHQAKIDKLTAFVERAIRDGLTLKLVEENILAGRPPHFIEGEHSPEPA